MTTYTAWNPSDKSNFSLSVSNTQATATSTGAKGVRGITAIDLTQKSYIEFVNLYKQRVDDGNLGVADGSAVLTNYPGSDAHTVSAFSNGGVYVGSTLNAGMAAWGTTGSVKGTLGMAIDGPNKLIWFTVDGKTWNAGGTANPATGVGGYSLAGMSTPIYPFGYIYTSGSYFAINEGSMGVYLALPSGFSMVDTDDATPNIRTTHVVSEAVVTGGAAIRTTHLVYEVVVSTAALPVVPALATAGQRRKAAKPVRKLLPQGQAVVAKRRRASVPISLPIIVPFIDRRKIARARYVAGVLHNPHKRLKRRGDFPRAVLATVIVPWKRPKRRLLKHAALQQMRQRRKLLPLNMDHTYLDAIT